MLKIIRVLFVLIMLALLMMMTAWRDQPNDWSKPTIVLIHPINADQHSATQAWINDLKQSDFAEIQDHIKHASTQFRHQPIQFELRLGRLLHAIPPIPSGGGSEWSHLLWGLKLQYFSWRHHDRQDGQNTATIYVNYYQKPSIKILDNSKSFSRSRLGIVNLQTNQAKTQHNVELAHEILHTFGAKDKFDQVTGQPEYPTGYADPNQDPLYPQYKAELMAKHIPISKVETVMPLHLSQTMVSATTAKELGWSLF
jgi:hypothetical protein